MVKRRKKSGQEIINPDVDWRRRPRKDVEVRSKRLNFRLTETEYNAIKLLAEHAGMNMADFLVCRGLRKKRRVG